MSYDSGSMVNDPMYNDPPLDDIFALGPKRRWHEIWLGTNGAFFDALKQVQVVWDGTYLNTIIPSGDYTRTETALGTVYESLCLVDGLYLPPGSESIRKTMNTPLNQVIFNMSDSNYSNAFLMTGANPIAFTSFDVSLDGTPGSESIRSYWYSNGLDYGFSMSNILKTGFSLFSSSTGVSEHTDYNWNAGLESIIKVLQTPKTYWTVDIDDGINLVNEYCYSGSVGYNDTYLNNSHLVPSVNVEYAITTPGGHPRSISVHPSTGEIWFAEPDTNKIGRMDATGVMIGEYVATTPNSAPYGIAIHPSTGEIWFTEINSGKIGRMSALGVMIGEYSITTPGSSPYAIAIHPVTGEIWFVEWLNKIGRMDATGVMIGEYATTTPVSHPMDIAIHPVTGDIWFVETAVPNKIGRMSALGVMIGEYSITTPWSGTCAIAIHPSTGEIWFTEQAANRIGRMDATGTMIGEYSITTPGNPSHITVHPVTGEIWFTEDSMGLIGRMSALGVMIGEYSTVSSGSNPSGITVHPVTGEIWFTESAANNIGKMSQTTSVVSDNNITKTLQTTDQLFSTVLDDYTQHFSMVQTAAWGSNYTQSIENTPGAERIVSTLFAAGVDALTYEMDYSNTTKTGHKTDIATAAAGVSERTDYNWNAGLENITKNIVTPNQQYSLIIDNTLLSEIVQLQLNDNISSETFCIGIGVGSAIHGFQACSLGAAGGFPSCSVEMDSPAPGIVQNQVSTALGQIAYLQAGQPAGVGSEYASGFLQDPISTETIWFGVGPGTLIHGFHYRGASGEIASLEQNGSVLQNLIAFTNQDVVFLVDNTPGVELAYGELIDVVSGEAIHFGVGAGIHGFQATGLGAAGGMPACSVEMDSPSPGTAQTYLSTATGQIAYLRVGQPGGAGTEYAAQSLYDTISNESVSMGVGAGASFHGFHYISNGIAGTGEINLDQPFPYFMRFQLAAPGAYGCILGFNDSTPAAEYVVFQIAEGISGEAVLLGAGVASGEHGIRVIGNGTYIELPNMTTANRPATPVAGMMVFDTTLNQFIGFNGTIWVVLG